MTGADPNHQTLLAAGPADPPTRAPGRETATWIGPASYRGPKPADAAWSRHRLRRLDAVLAVCCFALTLLVRWPFIQKGETLLHSDEAIVGLMAQDIAAGARYPLYFYGQRYMGALEAYAVAAVSPLFDDPIQALRFAPACFFALMVVVQFCMLTRWFGRRGGLIGVATLLAASPMFMQWSISARGGYVEILLWGAGLLWAYSEWFVPPVARGRRDLRRFAFGALIGSGLWINPSIVLFLVPIAAHSLLNRPLARLRCATGLGPRISRVVEQTGRGALPLALLGAVLMFNLLWTTWVGGGRVHSELLLGLVPKPAAVVVLGLIGATALLLLAKRTTLISEARALAGRNGMLIFGVLVGAAPAVLYVFQTVVGSRTMDPSLPLGLRPIWKTGETLVYLIHGLPLLFSADPRPFLQLVGVGRDTVTLPLDLLTSGLLVGANRLIIGALTGAGVVLLIAERRGLSRLLRLRPTNHSPAVLLLLGAGGTLALYVLGGCTLDFTTIRYLVPLWVFLPGLLAAVFVSRRFKIAATLAPCCLLVAWASGQAAMSRQLGAPHPLRQVADLLVARGIDPAVAEPLDAHLLSYLTRQRCRTIEFESFWPRLKHYFPLLKQDAPIDYIVQTADIDRTWDWIQGGWPGQTPPETKRFLWPKLRRVLLMHPEQVELREPLADGYERIRLRRPLPDRNIR